MGAALPEAKASMVPMEAGKGKEEFSPRAFGRNGPPDSERINFCYFKAKDLRLFVMAFLGNEYFFFCSF